jgi:hypothetical protein
VVIQTIRTVLGKAPVEIPGLADDPFISSKIENLRLLTAGRVTTLYGFRMGGRHYALKTLSSIHHRHTLRSIREKTTLLERIGYPKVRSLNEEHNFYIMDFVSGESVFEKVILPGRRRHVRKQMDLAAVSLLSTVAKIHAQGWLLNDLSWRNFMFTPRGVLPVDADRIRSIPEEAEYIATLDGKATYTTPLFLSVAQCLNRVPSIKDEMQGIALMTDCLYNGDYLVGAYLEAEGLDYSRRNQALMLLSGFYPPERCRNLPEQLREPIRKIIVDHDTSLTAQELLRLLV